MSTPNVVASYDTSSSMLQKKGIVAPALNEDEFHKQLQQLRDMLPPLEPVVQQEQPQKQEIHQQQTQKEQTKESTIPTVVSAASVPAAFAATSSVSAVAALTPLKTTPVSATTAPTLTNIPISKPATATATTPATLPASFLAANKSNMIMLRSDQKVYTNAELHQLEIKAQQSLRDKFTKTDAFQRMILEYNKHNQKLPPNSDSRLYRRFTNEQINAFRDVLIGLADAFPSMAIGLARTALGLIENTSRAHTVFEYLGVAYQNAKSPIDALCCWHMALKAELPPMVGTMTRKSRVDDDGNLVPITQMKNYHQANSEFMKSIRNQMLGASREIAQRVQGRWKPKTEDLKPFTQIFKVIHHAPWQTPKALNKSFHIFNPSIVQHPKFPKKFLVNLRSADYFMKPKPDGEDKGRLTYYGPKGTTNEPFSTQNWITVIDQDSTQETFARDQVHPLRGIPTPPFPNPSIAGYEDVRLVWDPEKKDMWMTFTSLEMKPNRMPTMCLAKFDYDTRSIVEDTVTVLEGFDPHRTEKNWMGFFYHGHLCLVYELSPTTTVLMANTQWKILNPLPKPLPKPDGPSVTSAQTKSKTDDKKDKKEKEPEWTEWIRNPDYGKCRVVSMDLCLRENEFRGSSPLISIPAHIVDAHPELFGVAKALNESSSVLTPSVNSALTKDKDVKTDQKTGASASASATLTASATTTKPNQSSRTRLPDDQYFLSSLHVSDFPRYAQCLGLYRLRPSPHSVFRPFSLQLIATTTMYVFQNHDVEFSCGLAFNHDATQLCMPYAIRDQHCWNSILETTSVMKNMELIPDTDELDLKRFSHLYV